LVIKALQNSDNRIATGKSVTAYFLFAALLWEPVRGLALRKLAQGDIESIAYQDAASEIIARQLRITALPRHINLAVREVWSLQPKFNARIGAKPSRLMNHPRFRAAYDFLALRAETGGADQELVEWWQRYQSVDDTERRKMTQPKRSNTGKNISKSGRKRNYRKKTPRAPHTDS
jgi:poly(A) polymerase